jgi:3-hydroxyisobutyrate dehydrogenase
MPDADTIAFLGAGGRMGLGMAANIARSGRGLSAWNRTREKAEPLAAHGARLCDTPSEAASGARVIVTMLSDADAAIDAMQGETGALASAGEDSVWVQMSTIGEQGIERCIELARSHGIAFVDAPVLGTKQPAEEGKLVIMASGPAELRELLQPIFDVLGQRTMWVGEAGVASRLKLVTNAWLVAVVEGGGEAIALAEGLGVDPALFLEAIDGGPLEAPYLRLKTQAMIDRNFEPSFSLRMATKDAMLAERAADEHGLDLPVLKAISRRMQQAMPEHGDEDLSATYLTSSPRRGES